jgi:hypothetical protein
MPYQRPRPPLVLASVLAVAGIVLAVSSPIMGPHGQMAGHGEDGIHLGHTADCWESVHHRAWR